MDGCKKNKRNERVYELSVPLKPLGRRGGTLKKSKRSLRSLRSLAKSVDLWPGDGRKNKMRRDTATSTAFRGTKRSEFTSLCLLSRQLVNPLGFLSVLSLM
jgi:hypothetical protein